MCKKFTSMALVFLLVLTMLPVAAFAAGDPKVGPPQNVTLYADGPEQCYTGMPEGQTQAIRLKLTHDPKFMQVQGSVKEGAEYAYAYNVHYQYRLDGGTWMDAYHFASADSFNCFVDGATYEEWVVSAYGTEESVKESDYYPLFKNMMLTFQQDGETWHCLDIKNHLVEARARYEMVDYDGYNKEIYQYTSEWSKIAQIGKGAAQVKAPEPFKTAPVLSDMKAKYQEDRFPYVTFQSVHPEDVLLAASNPLGKAMYYVEVRYDGGAWQNMDFDEIKYLTAAGEEWYQLPLRSDGKNVILDATKMELRMRYEWYQTDWIPSHEAGAGYLTFASPWSNIIGVNADAWSQASQWATAELKKAADANLIPDALKGQDLTKPITRAEFAALSVRLYEVMSGKTAVPAAQNPFTDTNDPEILKAYALGITNGTSATTFAPTLLIPREQVATMLTRTVQAAKPTLKLDTTGVTPFADDALISGFARESVYFMAKNGIIKGFTGNKFGPKNTTAAEKAAGYANATREQSLIIAVRSLETLK